MASLVLGHKLDREEPPIWIRLRDGDVSSLARESKVNHCLPGLSPVFLMLKGVTVGNLVLISTTLTSSGV